MRRRLVPLVVCLLGLLASVAGAQNTDPARLAPETMVLYAEVSNPGPLLDIGLAPKTQNLLANVDGYRQWLGSDQHQQLGTVVGVLEQKLGRKWDAALRDLVGGGIAVCFDPEAKTGFLAIRSRDRELLTRLNSTLIELIEGDAKTKGQPSPIKSETYGGFTGWTFGGEEVHVIVDDLLLVSQKADTLKSAIDRYRDPAAKNLAGNAGFAAARAKQGEGAIAWSWVDLEAVRKYPNVQQGLSKRSDNPVAELLFAGVIESLKQAPYLGASLGHHDGLVRLRLELPRTGAAIGAPRAWFFASEPNERALTPPGTIGTFTMFRDLAGLWLARDELFDEGIVAKFAQADTQLGLFFSGRDFGPEVLGELQSPLQLIVARQDYARDKPIPALKLPAFALVFQLKHPDDFAPELLMTYQKVVGIVNLTGAQQGKPQLLLSTESYQDVAISKATYLNDAKAAKENAAPHYNFSPSCARIGDHFVFGSTVDIVKQVVDASKADRSAAALKDNTAFTVRTAPLASILTDNKELLITQNMLRDGHSRTEAETVVQMLLDALSSVDRFVVRLVDDPGALALEATVGCHAGAAP